MPALLKIKRTIDNDVWKLNFALDASSLSEHDKELIRKFGEPQIDIGCTLLSGTPNELIIPSKWIRVRSDLPFTQEFDAKSLDIPPNNHADAQAAANEQALAFQTFFVDAYSEAFTTLRQTEDSFTGEYVSNI
jgi:hypothetical protein